MKDRFSRLRRVLSALLSVAMLATFVSIPVMAADAGTEITLSFGEIKWTTAAEDSDLADYDALANETVLVVPLIATTADGSDFSFGAGNVEVRFNQDAKVLYYQDLGDDCGIVSLVTSGKRILSVAGPDASVANDEGFVNAIFADTTPRNYTVSSGEPFAKIVLFSMPDGSARTSATSIAFADVNLRYYDDNKDAQPYTNVSYSTTPAQVSARESAAATYSIAVTDGAANPAGPVEAGTQVTVTADAKEGQTFKGWTGLDGVEFATGDANTSPATFKMPDKDLTVKAEFETVAVATYKIDVTDGKAEPAGPVEAGTQVTVTADTKEGQTFKGWTGLDGVQFATGDANTSPATFKMPDKDLTVKAEFETVAVATYKIDVTDGAANPAGPVEAGTQVTITADAKDGQTFKAWTGLDGVEFVTGDANTSPATFKMPDKDLTVKANFEEVTEEVTITFASGEGSGTMDAQKAPKGKPFTMPRSGFTAPDGKSFNGWKIPNNDALVAAGVQFTFDADTTVTAQYKDNTTSGGNGGGGGGCYVATAVYGSYDCPEVWTLRRFRDEVLAKTWYGRLFIRLYYAVSPTAVRLFGESEWFQNFWHGKLDAMVQNLQAAGFESTPYQDKAW